jgi:hypothetical protein
MTGPNMSIPNKIMIGFSVLIVVLEIVPMAANPSFVTIGMYWVIVLMALQIVCSRLQIHEMEKMMRLLGWHPDRSS